MERDGLVGADRQRIEPAAVGIDAAGQIDCHQFRLHRLRAHRRQALHHARQIARNRTRRAGSQQRVYDRFSSGQQPFQRFETVVLGHRAAGHAEIHCLIPLRVIALPQRVDAHLRAPLVQVTRSDQPIAAVVAGSDQHRDPPVFERTQLHPDFLGNCETSVLHQRLG